MTKEAAATFSGTITKNLRGDFWLVGLDDGQGVVLAAISGRLWRNHINIGPGDRVTGEVSPYDQSRGRILRRL
jgi:translation initiation factor IF-1